jgi:hypothetical protein
MIAISFPFRVDGYGRITSTSDPRKIWADRVRMVITTYLGERIMRPDFGSELAETLFDDVEDAPELILTAASTAFSEHLPELELVDVLLTSEDPENGEVSIEVVYSIPDLVSDPITQVVDFRMN